MYIIIKCSSLKCQKHILCFSLVWNLFDTGNKKDYFLLSIFKQNKNLMVQGTIFKHSVFLPTSGIILLENVKT